MTRYAGVKIPRQPDSTLRYRVKEALFETGHHNAVEPFLHETWQCDGDRDCVAETAGRYVTIVEGP